MIRLFREALLNVRHGGVVSLLAVVIVALTAALFSSLYLVRNAVYAEAAQFEENAGAAAFVSDELSEEAVKQLDKAILAMESVERTHIVWKDEALQRSQKMFGDGAALMLQGFEENPLPVTIEAFAAEQYRNAESMREMVKEMKRLEGVEDAVFENEALEQLDRMKRIAFNAGRLDRSRLDGRHRVLDHADRLRAAGGACDPAALGRDIRIHSHTAAAAGFSGGAVRQRLGLADLVRALLAVRRVGRLHIVFEA